MKPSPDEIDLHGMTVEEAIPLVDTFLNRSARARRHRVWIVHGKGSGILRLEVRSYLKGHRLVMHCSPAEGSRGGDGCTQVELND